MNCETDVSPAGSNPAHSTLCTTRLLSGAVLLPISCTIMIVTHICKLTTFAPAENSMFVLNGWSMHAVSQIYIIIPV